MSAFLAVIDLSGGTPTADAERALRLAHAGAPDVWSGPGALLASGPDPVDRALGRPAALARGRVVVAADARLDRHDELRERLAVCGSPALPDVTAAELIGLACAKWGADALDHLHGDFAFVAWDPARRRLLGARDRFGGRPLFQARAGDLLIVSNSLRAVMAHPAIPSEVDELFLADFLLFGFSLRPVATAFAVPRRVPAAHVLVASNGHVEARRHWSLAPEPMASSGLDAVDHVAHALALSVRERLPADRAAIFLSGGLDSSVVAAMARHERPEVALSGHSLHYERLIADVELPFAQVVGAALAIPIRAVALDHHTLFGFWRDGGESPEPSRGVGNAITVDHYARVAEDAVVALTGEGGDPLLMPDAITRAVATDGLHRTLRGLAESWGRESRRPPLGLGAMWLRLRDRLSPPQLPAGLNPAMAERLGLAARWRAFYASTRPVLPGRRGRARGALGLPVWSTLHELNHPTITGLPLELRNPLLDSRVVEAALALPSFPWCAHKLVLRELGRRCGLPPQITSRPKTLLQGSPDLARARTQPNWLEMPVSTLAEEFVDRAVALRPDLAWRQPLFTIRLIDLAHWSRKAVL